MGADRNTIKKIFVTEGMLISVFGSITGLLLGFVILYIQQEFGLLQLGPVKEHL